MPERRHDNGQCLGPSRPPVSWLASQRVWCQIRRAFAAPVRTGNSDKVKTRLAVRWRRVRLGTTGNKNLDTRPRMGRDPKRRRTSAGSRRYRGTKLQWVMFRRLVSHSGAHRAKVRPRGVPAPIGPGAGQRASEVIGCWPMKMIVVVQCGGASGTGSDWAASGTGHWIFLFQWAEAYLSARGRCGRASNACPLLVPLDLLSLDGPTAPPLARPLAVIVVAGRPCAWPNL